MLPTYWIGVPSRGSPVSSLYKLPVSIISAVCIFLLSPDTERTVIALPVLNYKGTRTPHAHVLLYIHVCICIKH